MSTDESLAVATVLSLVRELKQLTPDLTRAEVVRAGIEIAQRATSSHIAYIHFLNDDQNTIELGAWSHETLEHCTAVYDRHYPIAQAGIWADSARLRTPCVHNDYASVPDRRGLPDGHSQLVRHLGLPVVDEGAVRMLIGVGNKEADYTPTDVELLDLVATRIWSVLKQRVLFEEYLDLRAQFRALKQVASATSLVYDVEDDALRCDGFFTAVFGAAQAPTTLDGLLGFVMPSDIERVRQAMCAKGGSRCVWWIHCRRDEGEVFLAELKLQFRPREIGRGVIVAGTIQDMSERLSVQRVRTANEDRDFVTGLPNRAGLVHQFQQFVRRSPRRGFALLALEVRLVGAVNSRDAPLLRDALLRACATRVAAAAGAQALLAAPSEGIFEVVLVDAHGREEAVHAAERIVGNVADPVASSYGQDERLQVSGGLALNLDGLASFREVHLVAERALFRASSQGGGTVVDEVNAG